MVRPCSCIVKGCIPSSRRYLPTYVSEIGIGGAVSPPWCAIMRGHPMVSDPIRSMPLKMETIKPVPLWTHELVPWPCLRHP